MGADPTENSHHALYEERRLHQAAVDEVSQVVDVGDVVALELEARAVGAARGEDAFDVGKGVPEHLAPAGLQVLALTVVPEFPVTLQHGIQAEVH